MTLKVMLIKEEQIEGTFEGFTPFTISCDLGMIHGTFQHKENRICVSHAMCLGCFKELIEYIIKKFNTNRILIYNIMNMANWYKLRGFKEITIIDSVYNEPCDCLEGEWQI